MQAAQDKVGMEEFDHGLTKILAQSGAAGALALVNENVFSEDQIEFQLDPEPTATNFAGVGTTAFSYIYKSNHKFLNDSDKYFSELFSHLFEPYLGMEREYAFFAHVTSFAGFSWLQKHTVQVFSLEDMVAWGPVDGKDIRVASGCSAQARTQLVKMEKHGLYRGDNHAGNFMVQYNKPIAETFALSCKTKTDSEFGKTVHASICLVDSKGFLSSDAVVRLAR